MPWPQKPPPRALTRGQSFPHNKMGFSAPALVWMHPKRFQHGVLGRPQDVAASSGMYSPTRPRPYLKIILKYIWWGDRCCLAAILPVHSHKTSLQVQRISSSADSGSCWRLGSSGKAIKQSPPQTALNQWQERTKIWNKNICSPYRRQMYHSLWWTGNSHEAFLGFVWAASFRNSTFGYLSPQMCSWTTQEPHPRWLKSKPKGQCLQHREDLRAAYSPRSLPETNRGVKWQSSSRE